MPSPSPADDEAQQYSTPYAKFSSTPLRSDRARQSPAVSRGSPLLSRKRQAKQPLPIRMNLTETQVDKITSA